ncbi:MAG: ABC transporter substrate-binding protein [Spirochaetaceae bacterium]|jgi:ribose transport system substrate-binding protein|nr:ABC transporter substrate-binding protein [Spirochaetaceae bacterium]
MKLRKLFFLTTAMVVIASVFALGSCAKKSDGKIKVTLITMDSIDEHWLSVRAGAEAKAAELGNVNLTFNAPQGKVDAAEQLKMVEDAVTKKSDIIMLAPLNADALVPGVEKAHKAGIKVIFIDTSANTEDYDAYYSTDNGAAARLAADELGKLLNGKGKIAIINAQAGAATTMLRENDFVDQIKTNFPGITIVGTQYSDGDKTKALNIATDFMTANPDLAGFYGCNEGSTVGGANAVKQKGKSGVIKFVGFDWSEETKSLIKDGTLQATMRQNPYKMGYEGLQAGVDAFNGKPVERKVDTGVTVVTIDNVDSQQ